MDRSGPPPNCKEGGIWGTATYVGDTTKAIACLGCLCCGCLACCVLLCPQDKKDAYCVDGKVYDAGGAFLVEKKGDNFVPAK